jgi:hypothetical protein
LHTTVEFIFAKIDVPRGGQGWVEKVVELEAEGRVGCGDIAAVEWRVFERQIEGLGTLNIICLVICL